MHVPLDLSVRCAETSLRVLKSNIFLKQLHWLEEFAACKFSPISQVLHPDLAAFGWVAGSLQVVVVRKFRHIWSHTRGRRVDLAQFKCQIRPPNAEAVEL